MSEALSAPQEPRIVEVTGGHRSLWRAVVVLVLVDLLNAK